MIETAGTTWDLWNKSLFARRARACVYLFAVSVRRIPAPGLMEWAQFLALFFITLTVLFDYATVLGGLGIVWVGQAGGVFRPERRGQVHDIEDLNRDPLSHFRAG